VNLPSESGIKKTVATSNAQIMDRLNYVQPDVLDENLLQVQAFLSSAHFRVCKNFPLLIHILSASAEARVAYSTNSRVPRLPPPSAGDSSA
jgi:hypothetical protein